MAEREGFEPSRGLEPLHDFQSCLFVHSSISPCLYMNLVIKDWRRGWDLNPRDAHAPNGFRDRHIRPLCHLSMLCFLLQRSLWKNSWRRLAHSFWQIPSRISTVWFSRLSWTRFIREITAPALGS